eukprot:m.23328 g.23328  ORF g.23328 m.23328 type:complete len:359 (+) comp8485_c0_seq1:209-1285(+)
MARHQVEGTTDGVLSLLMHGVPTPIEAGPGHAYDTVLTHLTPADAEALDGDITAQNHSGLPKQLIIAEGLLQEQRFPEALAALEDAVELASEGNNTQIQLQCCVRIARLHLKLKQLQAAATVLHRILELARQLQQTDFICLAYDQLGNLHLKQAQSLDGKDVQKTQASHLHDAAHAFESLLTLSKTLHNQHHVCEAHKGMAMTASALANWEVAYDHMSRHVQLAPHALTPNHAALACDHMCDLIAILVKHGQGKLIGTELDIFHKRVELRWQQAAHAAVPPESTVLLLSAYWHLGQLYEYSGSFTDFYGIPKAREMYQKVLEVGKKHALGSLGTEGAEYVKKAASAYDAIRDGSCAIS